MTFTDKEKERINKKRTKPRARYRNDNRSEVTKILFSSGLFTRNHWLFKKGLEIQDVYFLSVCDCVQTSLGYFSLNDIMKNSHFNYASGYAKVSKFMEIGLLGEDKSKGNKGKRYYITTFGRDILKSLSRVVLNYLEYGKATYEMRMVGEDNPGYRLRRASPSGSTDNS